MDCEHIKNIFAMELDFFDKWNPQVRDFTIKMLSTFSDCFMTANEDGTENEVMLLTKNSLYIAETLFQNERRRDEFSALDMDVARSALLLRDGYIYGNNWKSKTVIPEHALKMSSYIRNDYWESFLPVQIRAMVADAVESHTYGIQEESANAGFKIRSPQTHLEWFVNDCCRLSGVLFPMTYPNTTHIKPSIETEDSIPFDTALSMARQMVKYKKWDGVTHTDTILEETFIFLNGVKTDIPIELRRAFQTLGHANIAKKSPYFNGPVIYNYENFRKIYPEWTGEVFGYYDHYYVKIQNEETIDEMPITNEQASMLGVNVNQRENLEE